MKYPGLDDYRRASFIRRPFALLHAASVALGALGKIFWCMALHQRDWCDTPVGARGYAMRCGKCERSWSIPDA